MGVKEIITINVGQAGCHIGEAVTKQYVAEANGSLMVNEVPQFSKCFFEEYGEEQVKGAGRGQYKARMMFLDSDPTTVDRIKNDSSCEYYNPDDLRALQVSKATYQDGVICATDFDTTAGEQILNARINKLLEKCDNIDGVIMNYALSGGTGSGLPINILESNVFSKCNVMSFQVWPSNSFSSGPVAKINTVFSLGWHMSSKSAPNANIVVDNEALYNQLQRGGVESPKLRDINQMIALIHSSITLPFRNTKRRGIAANTGLDSFAQNVTSDKLNFITAAYAPITSKSAAESEPPSLEDLFKEVVNPENCFVNYKVDEAADDDKFPDECMHSYQSALFRGREDASDPNRVMDRMQEVCAEMVESRALPMAEYREFNAVSESQNAIATLDESSTFREGKDLTMFANNAALGHVLEKRILVPTRKFNNLYDSNVPFKEHYPLVWEPEWNGRRRAIYDYIDAAKEKITQKRFPPTDTTDEDF